MAGDQEPRDEEALTILSYSSNRATREDVRLALGRKVAADLPPVRVLEVATQPAVLTAMDAGGIDLAILDGEAVPDGAVWPLGPHTLPAGVFALSGGPRGQAEARPQRPGALKHALRPHPEEPAGGGRLEGRGRPHRAASIDKTGLENLCVGQCPDGGIGRRTSFRY